MVLKCNWFLSYTALDLFHRRLFKVFADEMDVNVKPISWAQSHLSARKIRTSQSFEIFFQHFLLLLIRVTFWSSRWSWRWASTVVSMPFSSALECIQCHAFSLLKMKFGDLPVSTRWFRGILLGSSGRKNCTDSALTFFEGGIPSSCVQHMLVGF